MSWTVTSAAAGSQGDMSAASSGVTLAAAVKAAGVSNADAVEACPIHVARGDHGLRASAPSLAPNDLADLEPGDRCVRDEVAAAGRVAPSENQLEPGGGLHA